MKNNKLYSIVPGLVLGLTLVFFVSTKMAYAQATQLNIAVVDTKKVLQLSQAMKQVEQAVSGRRNQSQQEFRQKEQNLLAANQELVRQKSILAPEVFAQKRADIDQKAAIIRSQAKERNSSLNKLRSSGLKQIKKHLDLVIKQIVESRGFDLILSKNTIVYSKNNLDITDEVIQKLNASLPAVSIQ